MDIISCQRKHRKTAALSGLRNWYALSRIEEFVEDAAKKNHSHHRNLFGGLSSRLEFFGQKTLVEYLSDKIEKDIYERRIAIGDLDSITYKNRKPKIQMLHLDSKRTRQNDKQFVATGSIPPLMITKRPSCTDNFYKHATTPAKKSEHKQGKRKKKQSDKHRLQLKVTSDVDNDIFPEKVKSDVKKKRFQEKVKSGVDKQRFQVKDDTMFWSKSEENLVNNLSRISLSSNSDSSLGFCMSSESEEQVRHGTATNLPEKYIIGRHFYNLISNSKSKTSQMKVKQPYETHHEIKEGLSMNDCKLKRRIGSSLNLSTKSTARKSRNAIGKLCRSELKHSYYKHLVGGRKSIRPKLIKTKSKHCRVHLDSEGSVDNLSPTGSQKDRESCSSSMSNCKPLRTAMKKTTSVKQHNLSPRCVRFDCKPSSLNDASVAETKPHYELEHPAQNEHSLDVAAEQIRSPTRWNPASRHLFTKSSKSSSCDRHSSPSKLEANSYEDWQPVVSYSRLKSDDDTLKNDYGTVTPRRLNLPRRKFRETTQSVARNCTLHHRSVPTRNAYSRLYNQGESRSVRLNKCDKQT